jgi:small subunit ribosomal protein S18
VKKQSRTKFRPEFPADFIFDYKDPATLTRFLMEGGKIVPMRISKLSASQQRKVNKAIKRARTLGLLPNGTRAYDDHGRPEAISAKPFSAE